MNTYEKVSCKKEKIICIVVFFASIVFSILFGILYKKELEKKPLINIPSYVISENDWTTNNVIITITNPLDDIKEFSFDGGNTFQKESSYTVKENGVYEIVVRDINDRLSRKILIPIDNIDRESPIINVENTTTVQLNSPYSLRNGVSVTDSISGLKNDYTTVPKTIDTSVEGTYSITYVAFDKAGNYSEKKRTIIVKDIKGNTWYRYRTVSFENYECEPYTCNCVKTNVETCPAGYHQENGECCQTCNKMCRREVYGEWSKWSRNSATPSATLEVETKVE